jgi:hypothetical protein
MVETKRGDQPTNPLSNIYIHDILPANKQTTEKMDEELDGKFT